MRRRDAVMAGMLALVLGAGAGVAADPVTGMWLTPADRKKLVSHIQIRACGAKFCGKVIEAFDIHGRSVKTRNVGRELFWDVEALGNGRYGNGTVFVPLLNVTARASLSLQGDRLKVTGCKGAICDGQVWTRIK